MARDDPFAGISLTGPLGKLDQQLFAPEPSTPGERAEKKPVKPKQLPAAEAPAEQEAFGRLTQPTEEAAFELDNEALYKATFTFTEEELFALDNLKVELHHDLDKKVTKYDLVRAALHMMVEDYRKDPKASYVSTKLARKQKP